MDSADERRRYYVTPSLTDRAHNRMIPGYRWTAVGPHIGFDPISWVSHTHILLIENHFQRRDTVYVDITSFPDSSQRDPTPSASNLYYILSIYDNTVIKYDTISHTAWKRKYIPFVTLWSDQRCPYWFHERNIARLLIVLERQISNCIHDNDVIITYKGVSWTCMGYRDILERA